MKSSFSCLKVFLSHNFFHCFCNQKSVSHFYRETTIENNQRNDGYLIQSNLDKAFKCTVVNLTWHSVKRGFFKLQRQFLYSDKRKKNESDRSDRKSFEQNNLKNSSDAF